METIEFSLILKDEVTKKKWRTENHNPDRNKDDYHREIKELIKSDVNPILKKKFGNNFDVEIRDNKIIIRSKIIDKKTGRLTRKSIETELLPEFYFEEVLNFIVLQLTLNDHVKSIKMIKLDDFPFLRLYITIRK